MPRKDIMLASTADAKRIAALGDKFFVQPKYNGIRCWVRWNGKKAELISSGGNVFNSLPHINKALEEKYADFTLKPSPDGELYCHKMPFEEIISRVKRDYPHPDSESIQYHIFDFKHAYMQYERLQMITASFPEDSCLVGTKSILLDKTMYPITWEQILDLYVTQGYEGIILRGYTAPYRVNPGKAPRSTAVLKFKPSEMDIYRIVGLEQGTGWCFDRLGAFLVEKDGVQFAVGSGKCLTASGRMNFWEKREDIVGRHLLVKHEFLRTSGNIPKCAVATRLLTDDEEEILAVKGEEYVIEVIKELTKGRKNENT